MLLNARSVWPLLVSVVSAVALALALGHIFPVVRVAENWSRDLRVATLTAAQPQSSDIVIIAVTEETLAGFPYRSPLDRRFLSGLLRTLETKGVKAIGLDLLLDQPSEPDKDRELRETLVTLSVPVVAATAGASDGLSERQVAFMSTYLDGVATGVPMLLVDSVDGAVRGIKVRRRLGGKSEPSFATAILEAVGIAAPTTDTLDLRFRGAPDAEIQPFATYPAHAVALLPDDWLRDRIALIGVDVDLMDRHRTAFSVGRPGAAAEMPGVLLQAHALSQILKGDANPESSAWLDVLIAISFALAAAGIVFLNAGVVSKAAMLVVALVVLWTGGFALFEHFGMLLPLVVPTLCLVLAAGFAYAWQWRKEKDRRQFMHDAFSKFVAPAVVDHMVEEPERLRLGGERRDVTFVFTDIADYTRLAEKTEPALLVRIMNDYLGEAFDIVFAHGGTVDKIVGDAIHVMFNAPLEQPDHPERAVACAMALDALCRSFADRQRSKGIDFGVTRIGVNTGIAVVGNFGGEKHFDYTATGDAINTAARLESVNKHIGTRICVSGTTVERCRGIRFRPVGVLLLKGKSEGVAAFEPDDEHDEEHVPFAEYMSAYEQLATDEAEAAFRALNERYPRDVLVRFHLERLRAGETGKLITMKEK